MCFGAVRYVVEVVFYVHVGFCRVFVIRWAGWELFCFCAL